jgi:hypothetical protein
MFRVVHARSPMSPGDTIRMDGEAWTIEHVGFLDDLRRLLVSRKENGRVIVQSWLLAN